MAKRVRGEPELSNRQLAKRTQRHEGEASATLAAELMRLPDSVIGKLGLEEPVMDLVQHARRLTSLPARRREERAVATSLRQLDLRALRDRLATIQSTGVADTRRLHSAESWRERLLADPAALAAFCQDVPSVSEAELVAKIASAKSERNTGRPPGAGKALFRMIMSGLEATAANQAAAQEAADAVTDRATAADDE